MNSIVSNSHRVFLPKKCLSALLPGLLFFLIALHINTNAYAQTIQIKPPEVCTEVTSVELRIILEMIILPDIQGKSLPDRE
jgi:hypothetical protein